MDPINYYKVLQVDPEAEPEVIKAAYRALSRKYHPDGSHPSTERMARLNDAYAVLNDPPARARHNDELERRHFTEDRGMATPTAPPRMRYQELPDEPLRPRKSYRRRSSGVGVTVQVLGIALCALGVIISGALQPFVASRRQPTPTPIAFRLTPADLLADFEIDGYQFTPEYSLTGDPVMRGSDPDSGVTLIIAGDETNITYATLLLDQGDNLDETLRARQNDAVVRLLTAGLGQGSARVAAREWIETQGTQPDGMLEMVTDGWVIRVWPASDTSLGITIHPVES